VLRLDVLPARHGDCLWLEYGDPARPNRILIDGGPGFAYAALRERVAALEPGQRHIDLLIVTHIDGDHIEGVIKLLRDTALNLRVDDIWFNGAPQLAALPLAPTEASYGVLQGEYLGKLIREKGIPWNLPFGGKAAMAGTRVELPGGARAILLSPTLDRLLRLRRGWNAELASAGIEPDASEQSMARLQAIRRLAPPPSFGAGLGPPDIAALASRPFAPDTALANGSSIAILFEYGAQRLLLLGDAFPDVVEAQVDRLIAAQGRRLLHVDAVKLAHHGSRANVSPSLLGKLECGRYVMSSDGTYFRHPDAEALARVICNGAPAVTLMFNYRSALTMPWSDPGLQEAYRYRTEYPAVGTAGISLRLSQAAR
jgi:hypothetical protein